MSILVTGGAGFIGANFVLEWMKSESGVVVNLDNLTYAGNLKNLESLQHNERHIFVHGDIADSKKVSDLLNRYQPEAIINFAAESHVDRSIHTPEAFIQTNIIGTFRLLESARAYHSRLSAKASENFRFVNISTDEVYGSLQANEPAFHESNRYAPNSPYSASKAAADHLVRAFFHTYGLPVITSNCSNNYGPLQFPEKLIPLMILNGMRGAALPIYGDGLNVRDWLFVGDHCAAIRLLLEKGTPGETYNIGGRNEKTNLDVVQTICELLDELHATSEHRPHKELISYISDRPGHDRRYAVNADKAGRALGWHPQETFDSGLRKTVQWYIENAAWVAAIENGEYRNWMATQYGSVADH